MPLLVLSASLGGCGTFMNVAPQRCAVHDYPHVYGGVEFDTESMSRHPDPLGILCGVVDLPLSLICDTMTLPITIPAALRHEKKREKRTEPQRREE